MSIAFALVMAASASPQPVARAVPLVPVSGVRATATASARIIRGERIRLNANETSSARAEGEPAPIYRQHRISGQRVLIEFN